jgi:NAD(P)-dependent dehydrogenase (short-subunit alcohol dehydrogenase family)
MKPARHPHNERTAMAHVDRRDGIDPLFDLSGRVIVLTGASSGIGHSVARCLAERGASVVAAARRLPALEALVAELPDALAVPCDVSDPQACEELVSTTIEHYGTIDVLINNAAAYTVIPAEEESVSNFRSILDTNLVSAFALSRAAAQHMLARQRGSIINVASIFGIGGSGVIKQASYAASKGGLINLTRELSAQWARRGVRVNAIAPAFFETAMTTDMWEHDATNNWVRRQTPIGRRGELVELHGAMIYLASEASSYVTGAVLPVDGGWTSV